MPPNLDNYKLRQNKPHLETWLLMKFINNALLNWKTSIAGIGAIAGGIGAICKALSDGFQMDDWGVISAAAGVVSVGFGGLFGKDSTVSNAPHPLKEAEVVK